MAVLSGGILDSLCKQIELFERANRYNGRSRERVVALGEAEELYFRLYPHHYRALQTIRIASQLGRMASSSEDRVYRCESQLISILMRIILDGLKAGDLNLKHHQRPSELAFTLWSLAFGARALMDTGVATHQLGIEDGFRVARDATELLLDALQWAPLSTEWDYGKTRSGVRKLLFGPEWQTLGGVSKAAPSSGKRRVTRNPQKPQPDTSRVSTARGDQSPPGRP
ncbi:MAG: hypothetical protein JXA69_15240 [Phycisphaerae bacterium]|nr:hypothetical protein [Phycisphaerae bacterium]